MKVKVHEAKIVEATPETGELVIRFTGVKKIHTWVEVANTIIEGLEERRDVYDVILDILLIWRAARRAA